MIRRQIKTRINGFLTIQMTATNENKSSNDIYFINLEGNYYRFRSSFYLGSNFCLYLAKLSE